jgi:hypothetical protein
MYGKAIPSLGQRTDMRIVTGTIEISTSNIEQPLSKTDSLAYVPIESETVNPFTANLLRTLQLAASLAAKLPFFHAESTDNGGLSWRTLNGFAT